MLLREAKMMIRILNYDDLIHDCRIIIEAGVFLNITPQHMDEWVTAFLKENMKWEGPYAV